VSKIIYITDRSRIVTREECPRKRYLNYDFDVDGKSLGIQRRAASLPLLNGTAIHEGHARVLGGERLEEVVERVQEDYRKEVAARGVYGEVDLESLMREQLALLEGMLRAFTLIWMPRILDEYEVIVSIEEPWDWTIVPGLVEKMRLDTVLRRKHDHHLVTLDYKSMSYISDTFARKMERSRQTYLYTEAASERYGEPVEIAYLGMAKGAWRKDTAKASPFFGQKIQASPYLYAYALKGGIEDIYQTEYTNKKGFRKVRTYDEMPMKEWIDRMWHSDERKVLNEQFTYVPAQSPTPRERRRVRELIAREELKFVEDINEYKQMKAEAEATGNEDLAVKAEEFLEFVAAPRRTEVCDKYGEQHVCPFVSICFNEGAIDTALEDGEFEPRIPHHSPELEVAA
jgi:hypothetical protein